VRAHTILAALALGACAPQADQPPAPGGAPAIVGLSQASTASFGRSPQGELLSVLYDSAILDWTPKGPDADKETKSLTCSCTVETVGEAGLLRIWVRGFVFGQPENGANLKFTAGSQTTDLTAQLDEENYLACLDLPLTEGGTRIEWTMELRKPPQDSAKLTIDSIDTQLIRRDTPALPTGDCLDPPPRPDGIEAPRPVAK
jgi:hypothetical protein